MIAPIRHPHRHRVTLVTCALSAVLALGARAQATEIAPPAPLSDDLGALEAPTTLARWLGDPPPTAGHLVTTSGPSRDRPPSSMIVGIDGRIGLVLPAHHASGLSPLLLRTPEEARAGGQYEIVLAADTQPWQRTSLAALSMEGSAGETRFDVRPEDRNPITLRTTVLDEVTARVVRTPEPSTLALFALGLLGLAGALAGKRRTRT